MPSYLCILAYTHPINLHGIFRPGIFFQFATGDLSTNISYLGGNTGLLFGRKHKFGFDLGYYNLTDFDGSGVNLLTIGIGGKFVLEERRRYHGRWNGTRKNKNQKKKKIKLPHWILFLVFRCHKKNSGLQNYYGWLWALCGRLPGAQSHIQLFGFRFGDDLGFSFTQRVLDHTTIDLNASDGLFSQHKFVSLQIRSNTG